MTTMNVEAIVGAYIKVRDEVAQIKANHKAQLEPILKLLTSSKLRCFSLVRRRG